MKNQPLFLVLCFLIFSCGTTKTTYENFEANPTTLNPKYLALNLPLGQIDLPSVLVGEEQTPSGGCFSSDVEPRLDTSASQIVMQATSEKSFEADLKIKFEKALVTAGLDASLSSLISNKINSSITGAEVLSVDPALSGPNFENRRCLVDGLNWYADKRVVVTGAVKASSLSFKVTDELSNDQQAKLDLALKSLNTDLQTSFKRVVKQDGTLDITAEDVYIGAVTSKLSSTTCTQKMKLKLKRGEFKSIDLCGNSYNVAIVRIDEKNYDISVSRIEEGLKLLIPRLKTWQVVSKPFGTNRIVNLNIQNSSENRQLFTVSITRVGIAGDKTIFN
jgi:hypothetical protein